MSVNKLYDQVASHYDLADQFGIISQTHRCFEQQIKQSITDKQDNLRIADFGVGDGKLLGELQNQYPNAKLIGIDMSAAMLARAKARYGIQTVQSDFNHADQHIAENSLDLIIGHYILAFIDYGTLLQLAKRLLKPGGVLSIAATTYDSFPAGHKRIEQRIQSLRLTRPLLKHWYQRAIQQTHTPKNDQQKVELQNSVGFSRLSVDHFSRQLHFADINACYDYGFRAGWLPNAINYRWLPQIFIEHTCKACLKALLPMPFDDQHNICVELLQKPPA